MADPLKHLRRLGIRHHARQPRRLLDPLRAIDTPPNPPALIQGEKCLFGSGDNDNTPGPLRLRPSPSRPGVCASLWRSAAARRSGTLAKSCLGPPHFRPAIRRSRLGPALAQLSTRPVQSRPASWFRGLASWPVSHQSPARRGLTNALSASGGVWASASP